jgi:hypothetical protein
MERTHRVGRDLNLRCTILDRGGKKNTRVECLPHGDIMMMRWKGYCGPGGMSLLRAMKIEMWLRSER